MTEYRSSIGTALREMRKNSGKTLAALAEECNRSGSYLSRVERNVIKKPDSNLVECIADKTGGDVTLFIAQDSDTTHLTINPIITEIRIGFTRIIMDLNNVRGELALIKQSLSNPSTTQTTSPTETLRPEDI